MDITPGKSIAVEVVAPPRSDRARKTLMRLFRKDPGIAHHLRWQKRNRPSWQTKTRGGRPWHHQMKSVPPIKLTAGARYELHATVDVIRDLQSVGPCVKVTEK